MHNLFTLLALILAADSGALVFAQTASKNLVIDVYGTVLQGVPRYNATNQISQHLVIKADNHYYAIFGLAHV